MITKDSLRLCRYHRLKLVCEIYVQMIDINYFPNSTFYFLVS